MNLQYGNHKWALFRVTRSNTNQTKLSVKLVLLNYYHYLHSIPEIHQSGYTTCQLNGTKLTITSVLTY
jgi:hypothetical protein